MLLSERDLERFMSKVMPEPNSGCWLWTDATPKSGYAQFKIGRVQSVAHAVSYWHFIGPVELGREVHHKCLTPSCVNPDHLEALGWKEHRDRHRKLKGGAALDPAKSVIDLFETPEENGICVIAEATGLDRTSIYKWMQPKSKTGTGGLIPSRHLRKILRAAHKRGINLPIELLIGGEDEDE